VVTLSELARIAGDLYPGGVPTLPKILAAWAHMDLGGNLGEILDGTGIGIQHMHLAMEDLILDREKEDTDLLMRCVHNTLAKPPTLGRHLLKALCDAPGHRITKRLVSAGLDLEILHRRLGTWTSPSPGRLPPVQHGLDQNASFLLRFGRDLTQEAERGRFDDLCERPQDMDLLMNALMRRRKGNAILTGPAGVGKTALAELFARQIVRGQVPAPLRGMRCFELGMGSLVAGTRYRGEFEERVEKVMRAVQAITPAVLFIDEIHLLKGAGRGEGAPMDAASLLKPSLARGEIRVIGATTTEEYRRHIEPDRALARRFQEIRMEEPAPALVMSMVLTQSRALSEHHGVAIPDDIVTQALSYIDFNDTHRPQPDIGIDLIEAAAIHAAREGHGCVESVDLRRALSQVFAPYERTISDSSAGLKDLDTRLKRRIIGQDHALQKVAMTLLPRLQGITNRRPNLGAFLFAGPKGVGKKALAVALAAEVFGSEKKLLHVDLREYTRDADLNRLLGSPPGYAGSDRMGTLSRWTREHGRGVLFFENVEQGHADLLSLLCKLLGEGIIHQGSGDEVNARTCLVVLTTTLRGKNGTERPGDPSSLQKAGRRIQNLLKVDLPQDLLEKLDEIVFFKALGSRDLAEAIRRTLGKTVQGLGRKGIFLSYDEPRLLDYLCRQLGDHGLDAGVVDRIVEVCLLRPISNALMGYDGPFPARAVLNHERLSPSVALFPSARATAELFSLEPTSLVGS
jgi:ATP-dependent Clp protease ATP-binding subunit ClpC